jgi:hypothetical protein
MTLNSVRSTRHCFQNTIANYKTKLEHSFSSVPRSSWFGLQKYLSLSDYQTLGYTIMACTPPRLCEYEVPHARFQIVRETYHDFETMSPIEIKMN